MNGMSASSARIDRQLLKDTAAGDAEAFGHFYRRYHELVLAHVRRRVREPEAAADVTAEVFAAALLAVHRGQAENVAVPGVWLLTIATNKLNDSWRRGRVEANARRQLGMEPLDLDDEDIARIERMSDEGAVAMRLARELPPDQWEAIEARILEEREYRDAARSLGLSEFVLRKRVSRGLARLRLSLGASGR